MLILRQGVTFGIVGGLQLLPDWLVFVALTAMGMPAVAGNLLGRIAGASLGFWLNGKVTFRNPAQPRLAGRPLQRFLWMWATLTGVSTLAMVSIENGTSLRYAWLAKPFVEVILAAISFWVSRQWVYR